MAYEFEGIGYRWKGDMLAARRRRYVELVLSGVNFTEAARAVGVSKRTGKVWRNGRTRAMGRNEAPCREWTEAAMPEPRPIDARYLSIDERIAMADGLLCGMTMSGIAARLGRSRSTACREVARSRDGRTGRYAPWRRGTNENTKGLLDRPRKTLGWCRPSEVFLELINGSLVA